MLFVAVLKRLLSYNETDVELPLVYLFVLIFGTHIRSSEIRASLVSSSIVDNYLFLN